MSLNSSLSPMGSGVNVSTYDQGPPHLDLRESWPFLSLPTCSPSQLPLPNLLCTPTPVGCSPCLDHPQRNGEHHLWSLAQRAFLRPPFPHVPGLPKHLTMATGDDTSQPKLWPASSERASQLSLQFCSSVSMSALPSVSKSPV